MRGLAAVCVLLLVPGCSEPLQPAVEEVAEPHVAPPDQPKAEASTEIMVTSGVASPAEPADPPTRWVSYRTSGTTTANAAGWGLDTALGLGVRAMDLFVPANATGLVVEVAWDDVLQDLDAEAHTGGGLDPGPPSGECAFGSIVGDRVWCDPDGTFGQPDAPSRIALPDLDDVLMRCPPPQSVEYGMCNVFALGFRSKDANAALDWTLVATVFFDGPPPQGFSAFPAGSR